MSERFNFYDVYGYVIPGFALLALLWLPIGIATGEKPDLGFADALGGLLVAYVLGHVLASVTKLAFPSGRRVSLEDVRRPSDDILDRSRNPNGGAYITKLEQKIKDEFGIDLTDNKVAESDRVALGREAFFLCRNRLVLLGRGAYAEQFQGMYSMMRGISVASLVAAYYLLGWLFSSAILEFREQHGWASGFPVTLGLGGLFSVHFAWVLVLFAGLDFWANRPAKAASERVRLKATGFWARLRERVRVHWPTAALWFWVIVAGWVGFLLGESYPALTSRPGLIVALAAGAVFVAGRCYASNEYFARKFAETVYEALLALPKTVTSQTPPA